MKKTAFISVLILLALAPSPTTAQQETNVVPEERSVFDDYLNPVDSEPGFLRIPGLDFRSSVGFSYASSKGFGDVGMGYYMGHFTYKLGSSVTLNWAVGVGSYMMGGDGMNSYQVMIPNFNVTWRPSSSVIVQLNYMQGSHLNPYYSRRGFRF